MACEKEWLQAGHMWLAHRGGFTAVVREEEADPGRAKVRVLQTGEVIIVDEDDLEKVTMAHHYITECCHCFVKVSFFQLHSNERSLINCIHCSSDH